GQDTQLVQGGQVAGVQYHRPLQQRLGPDRGAGGVAGGQGGQFVGSRHQNPSSASNFSVADALQDGQAGGGFVALLEPEGALGQELLDGGPEPLVPVGLPLVAVGGCVVQHDVLARLGGVTAQFRLELLVDVPGVEEQQVSLLDVGLEHVLLAKD